MRSGVDGIFVFECSDADVLLMPISSNAATAHLFLQRLLNRSCSECSIDLAATVQLLLLRLFIVPAIFPIAVVMLMASLLELCDVVVVLNAIIPTAACGVDGILVLELCDVVVVFDAVSPTADCGVDGILVLGLCM